MSHSVPFVIISTSGLSVYKLKEDLAWPLFLLFVERKESKQFQFCLKNQEVKVFFGSSLNIYERSLMYSHQDDGWYFYKKNPMQLVLGSCRLHWSKKFPKYFSHIPWKDIYFTPPIAEILCVKNGRAIVVCGFLMKLSKKCILKVWKKLWEPFGSCLLNK